MKNFFMRLYYWAWYKIHGRPLYEFTCACGYSEIFDQKDVDSGKIIHPRLRHTKHLETRHHAVSKI